MTAPERYGWTRREHRSCPGDEARRRDLVGFVELFPYKEKERLLSFRFFMALL